MVLFRFILNNKFVSILKQEHYILPVTSDSIIVELKKKKRKKKKSCCEKFKKKGKSCCKSCPLNWA